jgi:hypothetical protein
MGRPGAERAKNKSKVATSGGTDQAVTFTEGPPTRPPSIKHDNGFLDSYPRRDPTAADYLKLMRWRGKLQDGRVADFVGIRDLPDALDAYEHFLDGKGKDRTISYQRFVDNDGSGALVYYNALLLTRQAAERTFRDKYEAKLAGGGATGFQLTSSAVAVGGKDHRFPYPETENWQKTLGAHVLWLSGVVTVTAPPAGPPTFQLWWTIHAEDRYNFNPKNKDIATGIPDADNGVFEITGLAQQYMNYATLSDYAVWTGATPSLHYVLFDMPPTW